METNFLKLYVDLNKTLIKTLTIKSQISVDLINDRLKLQHGSSAVDPYDPYSWKYYRNVSGEYHATDIPMTIVSLDTLEEIIFTKDNLAIHQSTRDAYQYDSRYYYALLARYPEQEQLILGILYPADIEQAITRPNGSILSYPSYLVEPQEITLINELESYIYRYLVRWDVPAFGISEALYPAAQHAIMHLNLISKLLNLRLKRCKTNEVHSFHIREYLASHGHLDVYMPYMTLKQQLYLYRNLNYINRNSGKVDQFKTLVGKFLTDRRIPLNEFSVRQLAAFQPDYSPIINVRRKAVNAQYNVPEKDYFDLATLHTKEKPLAYGNPQYQSDHQIAMGRLFDNSVSSVMQSKDLESAMIDYSDAVPDTLESVLLRQWASMSAHGLYNAVIQFKDPKTLDLKLISVSNAFIYFCYIALHSYGLELLELPMFMNLKSRLRVLPTVDDLMRHCGRTVDLRSVVDQILSRQPALTACHSVSSFYTLTERIYQESYLHFLTVCHTEDLYARGYLDNMILSLYEDELLNFSDDFTTMDEWLHYQNLPASNYTYAEANQLLQELFTKSTGLTVDNTKLLKNIQKAMISIVQQLSSYSIQFITEINQSKIRPINNTSIRVGDIHSQLAGEVYVEEGVNVINVHSQLGHEVVINAELAGFYQVNEGQLHNEIIIDLKPTIVIDVEQICYIDIKLPGYVLEAAYPLYDPAVSVPRVGIGWEYYMQLTDTQRSQIQAIY